MKSKLMDPFLFKAPSWVNVCEAPETPEDALQRARDAASCYYPIGTQTGVHSMIEWCGVMGEHVKLLDYAWREHGQDPRELDQHTGPAKGVTVPGYMIAYLCEKLGCQLKPFIRGQADVWHREIEKWFEGGLSSRERKGHISKIVKTPGICGGRARIDNTRISVSTIESFRRQGAPVSEILSAYPHLAETDVISAFCYADWHTSEIDAEMYYDEENAP